MCSCTPVETSEELMGKNFPKSIKRHQATHSRKKPVPRHIMDMLLKYRGKEKCEKHQRKINLTLMEEQTADIFILTMRLEDNGRVDKARGSNC